MKSLARPAQLLGRFAADRRGVSAIVLALSLTSILGFAGLAVDVGLWYYDKRVAQGAADSAAFTAVITYNADVGAGLSTANAKTDATSAAKAVTATYGYTNGSNGVGVAVNDPPLNGTHKSPGTGNTAFEVVITKSENLFFSSLYLSAVSVASRGVALISNSGSGNGCILQLSSTGSTQLSNGVTVSSTVCGIAGNGPGSSSLSVIGGSNLTMDGIQLVGGITTNNGGQVNDTGPNNTYSSSTSDPYASYSVTAAEAGDTVSCSNYNGTTYGTGGATYTINPGVYCGGITINNAVTVTMNPGIYVIYGGSFTLASGTTTNATGGVTILLTGTGANYASLNINDAKAFNINAPSTGPTAGIALYGDPSTPSNIGVNFTEGAPVVVNGAIYFPNQTVTFQDGSGNTASCTQLIGASIIFNGSNTFNDNCSAYGAKSIGASTTITIVE